MSMNFHHNFESRHITLVVAVTYKCQCNCIHCAVKGREKNEQELSSQEIIGAMNQFGKIFSENKKKAIHFFGGEPLLRKDLLKLIKYAKNKGFKTTLDSNGYLLTRQVVRQLKKAGLDSIGISIDSANPRFHDKYRRLENCFERAIQGIKNCLKENLLCYVNTYATKENLKNGDLEKIIRLGRKMGVNFARILSPVLIGGLLKKKIAKLSRRETLQLISFRRLPFVWLESYFCSAGHKKLIFISPYGDIRPCPYIPFGFGNVKSESLRTVLKKMWKHPMFKIKLKNGECLINNQELRKKYLKIEHQSRL